MIGDPPTLTICRVMQVDEDIYSGARAITLHLDWPTELPPRMLPSAGSEVTVGPSPDGFYSWMRGSQAGKERIIAAAIAWREGWLEMFGDTSTGVPGAGPLTTALFDAVRDFQGGK